MSDVPLSLPLNLLVGSLVELVRPMIGTPREAETQAMLCNQLVANWQQEPDEACVFVMALFRLVKDDL